MITTLIKLYLIFIISIIIHETFHFIAITIIGKNIQGVYIGEEIFNIRIGKFYISPLVRGGYIKVDVFEIESMNNRELIMFFLSGSVGNLILLIISLFTKNTLLAFSLMIINITLIIVNLSPFFKNDNDITMLLQFLKNKKIVEN